VIVQGERRFIADGVEVRRIAIKQGERSVVAFYAIGVIEVLDVHGIEPSVAAADGREGGAAEARFTGCTVAEVAAGGAALAAEGGLHNELGAGGLLDVGQAGLGLAGVELGAAVGDKAKLSNKLSGVVADHAKEIYQL